MDVRRAAPKREATRYYLLVVILLVACPCAALAQQPNVLFIAIDDLNDWPLGGHPETLSPNIDRLAAEGMVFLNAQTASPACNPSRVAVLTGISPETSGILLNSQHPFRDYALEDAVTLPQHFKNHGYEIVGAGKIFHSAEDQPYTQWDAYPAISGRDGPDSSRIPLNGIAGLDVDGDGTALWNNFDWGPLESPGEPDTTPSTREFNRAEWAADQILTSHDSPIFVAVGFFRPHLPWYAPKKYFDLFPGPVQLPPYLANDLDDVPSPLGGGTSLLHADITAAGQWQEAVRAYLANIAFIDDMLGLVLDALEQSPEEWLVVLWSDHGFHLGEKDRWTKAMLWEESTRSILIMAGPGIPAGTQTDMPASLLDIYPTLIDLAGLTTKPELEGTSLVSLIDDPTAPFLDIPVITKHASHLAFRSQRWKYIMNSSGTEELYDHATDPNEWTNLAYDPQFDSIKTWLRGPYPVFNMSIWSLSALAIVLAVTGVAALQCMGSRRNRVL